MLTATLTADAGSDGVALAFTVENDGDRPVTLSFRTSQRVEFEVRAGGDTVWCESDGRMYAQQLGSETFQPGDARRYEARWEPPSPGEYTAVAFLATDDAAVRDAVTVTV